ncbi:hypothetical protein FOL47_006390 [Perkinsus chesapeaki]|uniref:Uncharacterized protein n=1 Tax=Perkinsus chesapeaki TaxID=330153 RepID=A0A7J6LT07_PERCH|nr:hypothetical protein FOL47_006390 [Perkinsus chesapeaki]
MASTVELPAQIENRTGQDRVRLSDEVTLDWFFVRPQRGQASMIQDHDDHGKLLVAIGMQSGIRRDNVQPSEAQVNAKICDPARDPLTDIV